MNRPLGISWTHQPKHPTQSWAELQNAWLLTPWGKPGGLLMAKAPVAAGTAALRDRGVRQSTVTERWWWDTHSPHNCCHSQGSEYNPWYECNPWCFSNLRNNSRFPLKEPALREKEKQGAGRGGEGGHQECHSDKAERSGNYGNEPTVRAWKGAGSKWTAFI